MPVGHPAGDLDQSTRSGTATDAKLRRMPDPRKPLLVFNTCPDDASADAIATALVDERLAACVSVLPGVRSVYRWQGSIDRSNEVQLLIKTTADRLDALTARLQALHPYELPEVLAVESRGGLTPYLDWVAEQTRDHD